jgi:nucleoside-diphosphate-sugar epimerase
MEQGKPGQSYIIAGPPHTLVEALDVAERLTGIRAPRLHPPAALVQAFSAAAAPLERLMPLPEPYTAEGLRVAAGVTYLGSSAKAQRDLGFSARPLEEGFRDLLPYEMQKLGISHVPV